MVNAYGFRSFGGPEVQQFIERTLPDPAPHEIAITVTAAGVNPLDHVLRAGALPALNGEVPFPQVLGMEAAGVATSVGADVDGIEVGDRVFGFAFTGAGTYARTTLLLGSATAKTPDALSDQWAATVPVAGTTALDVIDQLALPSGARLLINGIGGGVGLGVAQLARAAGLEVVGTADEGKVAIVAGTGAKMVDYTSPDAADHLRAFAPDGFDGVVDLVGGASLRAVAPLAASPQAVLSVGDPSVGEIGGVFIQRHTDRPTLERVAALMVEGVLDPHITAVHTLDRAAEALATVESGHSTGKTVLDLTV